MIDANVLMICLLHLGRGSRAVIGVTGAMRLLHSLFDPRARARGQKLVRV